MPTFDDQNSKRPGIFQNIASYTPLAGGAIYGGYHAYNTLKSDYTSVSQALRNNSTGNVGAHSAVESVGRNALQASIAGASQAAKKLVNRASNVTFHESIVGNNPQRFLRLSTVAFASTLSNADLGLTKSQLTKEIDTAMQLANKALSSSGTLADLDAAKGYMSGRLRELGRLPQAVSIIQELFQPISQGHTSSLFDLDKLTFSSGKPLASLTDRVILPSTAEGMTLSNKQMSRVIRGLTQGNDLPAGVKITANKGFRLNGSEFAAATIRAGRKRFDVFLPLSAGTNIMVTKGFAQYELPGFRTVDNLSVGGGKALYGIVADTIQGLGKGQDLDTVIEIHKRRMIALMSHGTLMNNHETAGQKLIRHVRTSHSYPMENLVINDLNAYPASFPKEGLMDLFAQNPGAEPSGPAQLLRGGVVKQSLIGKWFGGTQHADWSSRLYQGFRDINWRPNQESMNAWGLRYLANNTLDINAAKAGPGGHFNRFKPVNPGPDFHQLAEMNILVPHQLQLHVVGDEAQKLEKYGMGVGKGEAMMKRSWRSKLAYERILPSSRGEVSTVVNDDLIRRFSGTPMQLSPGTYLGVTARGKRLMIPDRPGTSHELVNIEHLEGRTRFVIKEVAEATEGFKMQQGVWNSLKATTRFRSDRRVSGAAASVLFGDSDKLTGGQRRLLGNIDTISSSSNIFKSEQKTMVQMASALKYYTAEMMVRAKGNMYMDPEAQKFMDANSPLDFILNKAGGEGAAYSKYVATVADFTKKFGIRNPEELGHIFGAVGRQKDFADEFKDILFKTYGKKAKAVLAEAQRGNFITWAGVVGADNPWEGKANRARLELRTADMIMNANWQLGDKALGQAMLNDLMSGAHRHDPTKIRTLEALERAYGTATGLQAAPELDNISKHKFSAINRLAVSQEPWFKEAGGVIELPEQLHAAAKAAGLSTSLYIPGEGAVGKTLKLAGQKMEGAAHHRRKDMELGKKHYRQFIDESFRAMDDVLYDGDIKRQTAVMEKFRSKLGMYMQKARQDVLKIRLGPGSGHVQAGELADVASLIAHSEFDGAAKAELTERIGPNLAQRAIKGEFATGRFQFLSQVEAKQAIRGIDWNQMPVTKEEFMSGKEGLHGLAWRNPTEMTTSAQPTKFFVHGGRETKTTPLGFHIGKYTNVKIGDETVRMDLGIAPGMKLDSDKDMLNFKIFTEKSTIDHIQGTHENWQQFEKNYEKQVLDRQVLAHHISKRMKQLGQENVLGDMSNEAYRKAVGAHRMATGKDVGRISKSAEEIMFALTSKGNNPEMNIMANTILSEIVETGTLKVKHGAGVINIADQLVTAFRGETGGQKNIDPFLQLLHDKFLGEEVSNGINYQVGGENRTVKVSENMFTYISKSYKEFVNDKGAYSTWEHLATRRQQSMAEVKLAGETILEQGGKLSSATAFLKGLRENVQGKFSFVSKIGLSEANAETIVAGAKNAYRAVSKTIPGPVMLGLAGSAIALAAMGDPGYAPEPLVPESQPVDPRVLQAMKRGTLLSSFTGSQQPQINPGDLRPSGGGPSVSGALDSPSAYIVNNTHDVRVNVHSRDMSTVDHQNMMGDFMKRLPGANLNARITDSRRPMSPNDPHRDDI